MPNLHYFNPGHETAILNGSPYYLPPKHVLKMQQDLAFLPAWYAASQDWILVDTYPDTFFLSKINKKLDMQVHPATCQMLQTAPTLPILQAAPWGLSPQSLHLLGQLREKGGCPLILPAWDEWYARLCARQTAVICLRSVLQAFAFSDKRIVPHFRSSIEDVERDIQSADTPLLLKAPYSSSGRGLRWIAARTLSESDRQWICGVLKKQQCVSIERVLDKVQDFAMEFYSDGEGHVTFAGLSSFLTAEQGAYTGNWLASQSEIEKQLAAYMDTDQLYEIKDHLLFALQDIYGFLYKGFLGVDMMVYRDENGAYSIHPCVEINMRYTMGLVALEIYRKWLEPGAQGIFRIDFHADPKETVALHQQMESEAPLVVKAGKIAGGYLSLCPVGMHTCYRAYVLVNPPYES